MTKVKEEVVETPQENQNVVLPKEQFDKMMEMMEAQSADIRVLKKSVSKYKLEENEAKEKKGKTVATRGYLKKLNGEVIVKWLSKDDPNSKVKNEILYQGTTPTGEVLKSHYITIDDKEIVTDTIQFVRSNEMEYFTKLKTDSEGNWVIQFDNPTLPQEYTINPKFINP